MRLPFRFVLVAGKRLRVVIDDSLTPSGIWGEYRGEDGEIAVSRAAADDWDSLRSTLRHECLHAALDLSGHSWGLTAKQEEMLVRAMDEIFHPAWEAIDDRLWRMLQATTRKRTMAKKGKGKGGGKKC